MDDVAASIRALALGLPDVVARPCWGEEGFFHRPPGSPRRLGRLFLTLRAAPTVRCSLALPRPTYEAWFGAPPARPRRGQRHASDARRGPFSPHPLYAWNAWAAAEAPTAGDLPALALAVREAYGRVVEAPA